MGARNKPVIPRAKTERMAAFLMALPLNTVFTCADVQRALPDVGQSMVSDYLMRKHREGRLERISQGRYRRVLPIGATYVPSGLVAQTTWLVLATQPYRRPLRTPEICGEVEALIGRPGVSLYGAVSTDVYRWFRSGHLERTGIRREYAYRVAGDSSERPPLRRT